MKLNTDGTHELACAWAPSSRRSTIVGRVYPKKLESECWNHVYFLLSYSTLLSSFLINRSSQFLKTHSGYFPNTVWVFVHYEVLLAYSESQMCPEDRQGTRMPSKRQRLKTWNVFLIVSDLFRICFVRLQPSL